MNIQHLKIIADQFQFKLSTDPIQQISAGPGGGHLCWKVKSDKCIFFIKQLDPKLNVHDKKVIARYELCESVAFRFSQHDIPAVYAIKHDDKVVTVSESRAYLIYPWIEGYQLNEVSADHAIKIAEILAKIHVINLNVPEIKPKLDIHTNAEIITSMEKAISSEALVSANLKKNQDMILAMNERYLSAIPVLKEKAVVTHGDVFPHNVIWQGINQPFLIDWEAVKKWNPTREAIRTCVAWSGVGANSHSLPLFEVMLNTYINFGGPFEISHVEAAVNGLYGSIINWLLYNIDLACGHGDLDRKDVAITQINACLTSALKLTELYPILFNSIMQIT